MTTIRVQISEADIRKFDLTNDSEIEFSDLISRISSENARVALKECNRIASEVGLNEMSLDEINAEINAVRQAKNNS
ncbi:MAG: hypothetical protein NWQ46_03025 [Spirosomaceae bacterium]|nr:hypothetical protein [Spirosomataceae bacterium]MDP5140097.1 hypothetical protein [Spirosomataceae bacterium]